MSEKKGFISVNTENIFPIIKKWLYSDQDIFLRELVSNGADAISKLKHLDRLGEITLEADYAPEISIHLDTKAGLLKISDNGIGMTKDEIDKYINQIAFSGAVDFLSKYQENQSQKDGIIGHFGLGFYSAFMVADQVEIDSLSHIAGSTGAHWESEDGMAFVIKDGDLRSVHGTTITIKLSDEARDTLDESSIRATLNKYCQFMPYPITFSVDENVSSEPINDTQPLWLKAPQDCTDEEYKDFYRKAFNDYKEPLFWIHLNMDYPFHLKGILYFPKTENKYESLEGRIKLYYNQVFVADNIKEVIPDFLFLLKGCLDCPELPLNVSRSFLQNDAYVRKLSDHIIKKVADKLNQIFKNDRQAYDKYWADLSTFVKYGCLKEEKFFSRIKDSLIFETIGGSFKTIEELGKAIYYTVDPKQQVAYVKRIQDQGHEVIILDQEIDMPFISLIEYKESGVKFNRIDADIEGSVDNKDQKEKLEKYFDTILAAEKVKLDLAHLGKDSLPALLVESENSRRSREMRKTFEQMQGQTPEQLDSMFPLDLKMVVNLDHPIIEKLLEKDTVNAEICQHIYDLARLSYGSLQSEDLAQFMARSSQFLLKLNENE